jgi:hypothetical protein
MTKSQRVRRKKTLTTISSVVVVEEQVCWTLLIVKTDKVIARTNARQLAVFIESGLQK